MEKLTKSDPECGTRRASLRGAGREKRWKRRPLLRWNWRKMILVRVRLESHRVALPSKSLRPRTWVLQEDRSPPHIQRQVQDWTSSSSRDLWFLGREGPPGSGSFHHGRSGSPGTDLSPSNGCLLEADDPPFCARKLPTPRLPGGCRSSIVSVGPVSLKVNPKGDPIRVVFGCWLAVVRIKHDVLPQVLDLGAKYTPKGISSLLILRFSSFPYVRSR